MRLVSFSELRKHATACFDAVERGETLQVYRHGRPIAVICPVSSGPHPRWLKRPERVRLNEGANLSDAVLEDRDERPR